MFLSKNVDFFCKIVYNKVWVFCFYDIGKINKKFKKNFIKKE